jgi:hypothetical protein
MNPRFLVFGDSHAGTLGRAAKALELDFAGGSVMAGYYMNDTFCEVRDGRFEMLSKLGTERLAHRLSRDGLGSNLLDIDLPILSTVGFNSANFCSQFCDEDLAIEGSPGTRFISSACFEAVVDGSRRGALAFYAILKAAGKTVYAVPSPQRFRAGQQLLGRTFETVMFRRMAALGVPLVDVRAETTDENGALRREFASTLDRVHANDAFGAVVIERFFALLRDAS